MAKTTNPAKAERKIATFSSVKPTRKGNYIILNTNVGEVFITDMQYRAMPSDCEQIECSMKDGYTVNGNFIKFAEPRLEFDGYLRKKSSDVLREKAAIAAEFGLNISL